jgi:hypothetical protein
MGPVVSSIHARPQEAEFNKITLAQHQYHKFLVIGKKNRQKLIDIDTALENVETKAGAVIFLRAESTLN